MNKVFKVLIRENYSKVLLFISVYLFGNIGFLNMILKGEESSLYRFITERINQLNSPLMGMRNLLDTEGSSYLFQLVVSNFIFSTLILLVFLATYSFYSYLRKADRMIDMFHMTNILRVDVLKGRLLYTFGEIVFVLAVTMGNFFMQIKFFALEEYFYDTHNPLMTFEEQKYLILKWFWIAVIFVVILYLSINVALLLGVEIFKLVGKNKIVKLSTAFSLLIGVFLIREFLYRVNNLGGLGVDSLIHGSLSTTLFIEGSILVILIYSLVWVYNKKVEVKV